MSVDKQRMREKEDKILHEWTVIEFINAINDYAIDCDIRSGHLRDLARAIIEDEDENE